jgi:hypothetical protein
VNADEEGRIDERQTPTWRVGNRPATKVELEWIPRVIDENVQKAAEGKQVCADAQVAGGHPEVDSSVL